MSGQIPPRMGPFNSPLIFERRGLLSEDFTLEGNPDYYIKTEPFEEDVDYAAIRARLDYFTEISGIRVVPHHNVIARIEPVGGGSFWGEYDIDENGQHKVLMHVAQRIQGISLTEDGKRRRNLAVPLSESVRAIEGIVKYNVASLDEGFTRGDIKPEQVMFGTIPEDDEPQSYMADTDYFYFQDESDTDAVGEAVSAMAHCVDFITDRIPHSAYLPVALEMRSFLNREDVYNSAVCQRDRRRLVPKVEGYVNYLGAAAIL